MYSSQLVMILGLSIGLLNLLAVIRLYSQLQHLTRAIVSLHSQVAALKFGSFHRVQTSQATGQAAARGLSMEQAWPHHMQQQSAPSALHGDVDRASLQAEPLQDSRLRTHSRLHHQNRFDL